ncbi:MAG TPA: hypothetical protein PKE00_00400 [Planctomycetota bacterium]|nr:hypothetical protein [Planctomycetota bacterium]
MKAAWTAAVVALCTTGATSALTGKIGPSRATDSQAVIVQAPTHEADLEFEAWAAEMLDLDYSAARRTTAVIAQREDIAQWTRARAYNDLVRLSRLSCDFSDLADVTRTLLRQAKLPTNQRLALTSFLRAFERGSIEARRIFDQATSSYDQASAAAAGPDERAAARRAYFTELRQATRTARRTIATLLPELTRNTPRPIQLSSNRPIDTSRDLVLWTRRLAQLQNDIHTLVENKADRADIDSAVASREAVRERFSTRGERAMRAIRIEIATFEREGNHRAAERLVDVALEIAAALTPSTTDPSPRPRIVGSATEEDLRQHLDDPIQRRGILRELVELAKQRLPALRSEGHVNADDIDLWMKNASSLVDDGAWVEAAQLTLDLTSAAFEALIGT